MVFCLDSSPDCASSPDLFPPVPAPLLLVLAAICPLPAYRFTPLGEKFPSPAPLQFFLHRDPFFLDFLTLPIFSGVAFPKVMPFAR